MSSKPTPGPFNIVGNDSVPGTSYIEVAYGEMGTKEYRSICWVVADDRTIQPEDRRNAGIITEALNVHHETGLTPQQLRADLNATKNVLGATREHVCRLEDERDELLKLLRRWNAIDAGSWAPDRHANEKRELIADTRATIAKVEGRS